MQSLCFWSERLLCTLLLSSLSPITLEEGRNTHTPLPCTLAHGSAWSGCHHVPSAFAGCPSYPLFHCLCLFASLCCVRSQVLFVRLVPPLFVHCPPPCRRRLRTHTHRPRVNLLFTSPPPPPPPFFFGLPSSASSAELSPQFATFPLSSVWPPPAPTQTATLSLPQQVLL